MYDILSNIVNRIYRISPSVPLNFKACRSPIQKINAIICIIKVALLVILVGALKKTKVSDKSTASTLSTKVLFLISLSKLE
jgi:hypothetical protein